MRSKKSLIFLMVMSVLFTTLACNKQMLRPTPTVVDQVKSDAVKPQPIQYSMVYFDLDGTALDTSGVVRPATIQAVQAFKARGGSVGIATGRTLEQAEFALNQIGPNLPVVLFNGGVIAELSKHQLKVLGNLDPATMQQCVASLASDTTIDGAILHFPVVSIPDRDTPAFKKVIQESRITPTLGSDLNQLSSDSLIKMVIFCPHRTTEKVYAKIRAVLERFNLQSARVVISSPVTVEVLPAQITKAVAIRQIAEQHDFSMEKIVAFGDSGNDLEMLKEVGLGVAMGNGRLEVQAVADLIIGPNYTDAIAKFLNSPCMR
ncbi:Cof-type HAD-IIB family hydrolase [candidate division KSB1 bacterium]|nr:Cof-type HAD-IIB family hydrolase [candidate division KSB1 bacterium]